MKKYEPAKALYLHIESIMLQLTQGKTFTLKNVHVSLIMEIYCILSDIVVIYKWELRLFGIQKNTIVAF